MKTFEGFKRFVGALFVAVLGVAALAGPAHAANRTVNGITIDTDLPTAQRGVPYDFTVAPTGGGGGPYSYQVLAGTPPPGITFNSDGRVFGVSCGLNGPYSLDVRVTSATGTVADFAGNPNGFTLQLTAGPGTGCDLSVSLGGLPTTGLVGTPYTGSVTATGGTTPYTFSIASGALPTGLTLDPATGVVSGTPTVAGVFNFVLSATDAAGLVGSQAYTITIALGVSISPATLPDGTFGSPYSQTVSASGGEGPPYTLSVSAGALPNGLTFNAATGAISGTPTQAGSFDFTISATDVNGNVGSRDYTVVIDPVILGIAPATLPDGTFGVAYSQTISASGGDNGPYTFSVTAGSLPNGLALDGATGVISGNPALVGSFSFTVTAADGSGNSGSQGYTVDIAGVNLTISPATLSAIPVDVPYTQALTVTGGSGTGYTCSVSAGSLPAGITLDTATCTLSGTPTVAGSYSFTISASDDAGNTGSRAYSLAVNGPVTVSPATLPDGTFGVAYSQTVIGAGGDGGPYTLALTAGALPNGLSFAAATGVISGTPTLVGSYSFTISATDGLGAVGSTAYTVDIGSVTLTLAPASLPNGEYGAAYSETVSASGGDGSYTYSVSAGSLPGGLSLDPATGVISGSPTALGAFSFTISVVDGSGNSGSQAYSITIDSVTLSISPTTLPPASINGPYSQALTVTGGSGSYTCAVTAGALPAGITLDTATCTLSGQATTVGSYSFTITATDSAGNTGSQAYSLDVFDALVLNPASLPDGTWGVAYDEAVSGAGGNGSYSYAVTAGALPNGLSLDGASGAITGTPSLVGSYSFTITVTDGLGETASQAYTVEIVGVALTITPANLPDGEALLPYSQALTVTGGSGSGYSCAVTAGTLPAGITLNAATCTLSGTPTTEGAYSFTITATDSGGNTGSQAYSLQIGAALVITITPATLPDGESGEAYSEQLSADGGVAPYTYAVTSGALPAGLTLNGSTGLISGTPTVFGDFSFTVTATDADGRVGSQAYSLTIEGRPDPTRDPELIGMIDGQFGLARRFGEGQIMNVMRHLEGNRSAFRCGLSADLGLSGDNDSRGRNSLDPEDNQARSGVTLGASGKECEETLPKLGYWVSGSLSDDDYRGQDFTSDALSAGLDFKFSDKLMAGAAVGFGWGESEFGSNGTQSDADATTFMAYLSYNPTGRLYVEAMVGGGDLSIDSDRYVSYDGSMVSGKRNGSLTLGSIGLAGDMIDSEKVLLTGYLRYDMVKIDLDRYEEQGSTQLALGFGAADQTVNSLVLGGRAAYSMSRSWGLLTPMVRAEYRLRSVGNYRQDMAYLDLPGIEYSLRQGSDKEGSLSLSLGFEALIQGWTLGMEYGSNPLSSSGMSGDMVRATVRYGF